MRPPLSCVQCIWVLWSGFTLVCKCCTFLYLVLFLVYEPCAINLCELSTYTNPIFCFLLRATSFLLWHCSAQDDTHNRSVTALNFMSMVAITISRYRLQREGGWVPLLLWIVLFEPPTPPTFFRMRNFSISPYECVSLSFLFHTLCDMNAYSRCV